MHSEDAMALRLTWAEAQELLRPPPSVKPTVVMVEDQEFEEYEASKSSWQAILVCIMRRVIHRFLFNLHAYFSYSCYLGTASFWKEDYIHSPGVWVRIFIFHN